ncbi:MAG TPA: hypothetical protein VES40_00565 [Ilumatobacteraceae bacterium]|nr:hypothetical protein [Ilumatobacteraceae bacterium]
MDFSKFKTPDWLMIGGGIGIFIFGFFKWVTVSVSGFSVSAGNVFDFFFTGTIPWFLVIGAAVITVLLALDVLKEGQAPWPLILLAMTAVAALLLLIRLIFNPLDAPGEVDVGRGIGMILSVVSGIVAAVGGYLNFTSKGGDIKELGDMDKLKASFSQGTAATSDEIPPPPSADPAPPVDNNPPPPPAT